MKCQFLAIYKKFMLETFFEKVMNQSLFIMAKDNT
jgi:hypothetical protein